MSHYFGCSGGSRDNGGRGFGGREGFVFFVRRHGDVDARLWFVLWSWR
jgi:hypothetical protein